MGEREPLSSREAFRGSLIRVEVETWTHGDRDIVRHPGASAVVAVTPADEVLLVKQFRESIRDQLVELPAGLLDVEGEDALEAAKRELREETGYAAREIEFLGVFLPSAGFTDERDHLFYAVTEPEPEGEPDHEIEELVRMPWERAVALARAGRFRDAKTNLGLLLAAAHRERE
jgi:ADP-ribose pyrophosphatase